MGDTDSSNGGDTSDSDCKRANFFAYDLAEHQRALNFIRNNADKAFCRVCFLCFVF